MFLEKLKEARESSASVFHDFLLRAPKAPNDTHVFFEGNDDPSFYQGFIHNYLTSDKSLHIYKCGKKKTLYEVYGRIVKSKYKLIFTMFFTDKDYSDILPENYPKADNIFVTDYYSIENYLVDKYMLSRILVDICHLNLKKIDIKNIEKKFQSELNNFHSIFRNISIWFLTLRAAGLKPNHNNLDYRKICRFTKNIRFVQHDEKNCIQNLEIMCGVLTPENYDSAKVEYETKITKLEPKKYIRGKYELWFFIEFVRHLIKTFEDNLLGNQEKIKIYTQITHNNAVEILGPRAKIPPSLQKFLSKHFSYSNRT